MDPPFTWLKILLFTGCCGFICYAEDLVRYTEAGVMVIHHTPEGEHHRAKREITRDIKGFNHDEKMAMLWRHNNLRSVPQASDMMYMEWDNRLEKSAQEWAEHCQFEHSDDRSNLGGYEYVGENLYAGADKFDPATVVQL
ncbi:cysteine-rich venom protein, partial [Elysia marginata]